MKQVNRHIISSLNWSTTFDRKEQASELQSRLSTWSNLRLQRELTDLFDAVCPPGQTWKIGSIELDLGTIDYAQLEPELSLRVRKQLMEKLTEMISYPNRHSGTEFEILDEVTTRLSLLRSFLVTGSMPWNSSLAQESANSMMAYQLKHNKSVTIEMLWEAGTKQEQVRKRMAWQFSDPVVTAIIRGLEPNNHEPIIDFTDRVTEIQRKESIVHGSATELRKNIWHWVLNYLYNERGTVFNKIAFMRSTIMQMAAHHNIRYEELMDLIGRAVNKIKGHSSSLSDFVHTLDLLSQEKSKTTLHAREAQEQNTDYWYRLEVLLRDPSLRRSESLNAELNDLVVTLSRYDKSRMAELVRTIGKKQSLRNAAVADLHEFSLEVVFSALLPAASAPLIRSMELLNMLGKEKSAWRENKILWKAALKFAVENRNATSDVRIFISYCVSEIARETHEPAESIFYFLMSARIPSAAKTASSLDAYADLTTVAAQTEESGLPVSYTAELTKLIELLSGDIGSGAATKEREAFFLLKASLLRKTKLRPKIALQALLSFPRKNALRKLLPFLTAAGISETLLQNSKQEFLAVLSHLERVAIGLKSGNRSVAIAELFAEYLQNWALEAILLQPSIDTLRFARYILQQLVLECGATDSTGFILFCSELCTLDDTAVKNAAIKMLSDHRQYMQLTVTERIKPFMHGSGKSRQATGKILTTHFTDEAFTAWRRSGQKETKELLNFLLPQGEQWMKKLVLKYKTVLRRVSYESQIELQLKELFWKCSVNYDVHRGNVVVFNRLFHDAVCYQYSLSIGHFTEAEKILLPQLKQNTKSSATEKQYTLKNGEVITLRILFVLIASCLEEGESELVIQGKKYELKELLELGLELKPAEIRKIIAGTPLTAARLSALKTATSFSRLSLWIMSDLRGEMNSAMEAVRMLHDLTALIIPGAATEIFLDQFWKEAWTVVTSGSWSRDDLKKLIRTSFTRMAVELGVDAVTFITEMKNKKIRISPMLRDNLIACFPAFGVLEENEKETTAGRMLAGYESRGLPDNLVEHLVAHQRIPPWFGDGAHHEGKSLLREIITHYPVKFLQVMKRIVVSESQIRWLSKEICFSDLIRSVSDLHPEKRSPLAMLGEFHAAIGKISASCISTVVLREIIFRKLLKAWTGNSWRVVAIENIWNEIVWDVCMKYNIPKKKFLQDMEKASGLFSPAIKIALESLIAHEPKKKSVPVSTPLLQKANKISPESKTTLTTKPDGIAVRNAGMVLLSTYVQILFDRLGLTQDKKFVSLRAQEDSVHYLQYVVTGLCSTEEHFLPLNKVLCGLPVSHPVRDGITLTDDHKHLINGLVKAAISHWPAIGDTSVEGFRGNWLVREGMLTEYPDKWELVVEKRAYDILMNKSPYSFSITRYPWMDKSLHVTWPY